MRISPPRNVGYIPHMRRFSATPDKRTAEMFREIAKFRDPIHYWEVYLSVLVDFVVTESRVPGAVDVRNRRMSDCYGRLPPVLRNPRQ